MNFIQKAAHGMGSTVAAFRKGLAGDARRPEFLSQAAQEHKWSGGQIGAKTDAQKRAVQNGWYYTAVNEKSMAISSGRLHVYWNNLEDEYGLIQNHALEKILRRPNPHMGRSFLYQYTHWWTELDGNSYWFLDPDEMGNLAEIWPLPAGMTRAMPGDKERFIDYFEYQANGVIFKIPAEYICHFRYPNPFDVFHGMAPLVAGMLPVDSDTAMARWNGAFFGQDNVVPSAIISLSSGDPNRPLDPGDVDAVKEQLASEYQAVNRKTVVTNAYDMAVQLLGWNAKDMDFMAGRRMEKEEIFGIEGVPMGMMDASATDANATVHKERFAGRINSELGMYAEEITAQIVIPWYHCDQEARFDDVSAKNKTVQIQEAQATMSDLTIDERRQRYWKLPALPDGRGDRLVSEMAAGTGTDLTPNPFPEGKGGSTSADTVTAPGGTANNLPEYGLAKQDRVMADSELRMWRSKSIKSLKMGKTAAVGFESEVITHELNECVLDGLECAETVEDIKAVFGHSDSAKGIIRSWRPWSGYEEKLNEAVSTALSDQAHLLINQLREKGADALDDPQMWTDQAAAMKAQLEPVLQELAAFAVQRVKATLGKSGISVNWDLANEQAVNWARQHAGDMVGQVADTTRRMVGEQTAQWAQSSEGLDGLIKRIGSMTDEKGQPVFNKTRAETIATTEATNTYAGANATAWASAGYAPAAIKPGLHVRCRCAIQPYKMSDGSKVMIWYTARDERVCTTPAQAPWGQVEGCKAMHKAVISEGAHLGEKV